MTEEKKETDDECIETCRRETQEAIDKALAEMARGGSVADVFEATGAPVEVVRLERDEVRFIGTIDLDLPMRMRWFARHYVYRKPDGQPFILSDEKRQAFEGLGFVHLAAFMIDPNKRN